jgi:uncharacterized protein involved in exopolysaccharide biosynthesis
MAVQIESQGQLQEFLGILKRRKWQIILPASIVIALAIAIAVIVPKKYVARMQVELRPVGVSVSSKEGANAQFQIRGPNRIARVLKEKQHAEFLALPLVEQSEFIKDVQSDIRVTTGAGSAEKTAFVNIEYKDINREWAIQFLEELSKDWIEDVLERDRRKAEDEAAKLLEEKGKLEAQHLAEVQTISNLKTRHGLSPTQPGPNSGATRNEDPIFARMAGAAQSLFNAELEVTGQKALLQKLQAQYAEMPATLPREKLVEGASNDAALQDLDKQIEDLRARIANLKPANSTYRKLSGELQRLEKERDDVRAKKTKASLEYSEVENPERKPLADQIQKIEASLAELEARVEKLKIDVKLLDDLQVDLHEVYRDLQDHEGQAARLQGSLDIITKRYHEQAALVQILSSPEANPFTIQESVNAGTKPTEPNPWLIVSFGLVIGLALGLAIALIAEFSKNCFRSVSDISRVMVVPVLGSIGTILTRRERRIMKLRRTIVGITSVALVGSILFVTWSWAAKPQLLSQDVMDAIEELRSMMR